MERAVRLAQLVREFHVGSERLQMFDGAPEKTLPPLLAARHYDVLVLGALTHRPRLADLASECPAALVDATSGDVLLVKPRAAAPAARRPGAQREQRAPWSSSSSELMGLLVMRRCASPCISRTADEVSPVTRMALKSGPGSSRAASITWVPVRPPSR